MTESGLKPLKRSRPSDTGAQSLAIEAGTPTDLIEVFSQRSGRLHAVERENIGLRGQNAQLRDQLQRQSSEFQAFKEETKRRAQASQTTQDLRSKEKGLAEDAYKREMARVADAAHRIKQAEAQQYAALDRAEVAEGELVQEKARCRRRAEQQEAAIKRLEKALADQELDAQLAHQKGDRPLAVAQSKTFAKATRLSEVDSVSSSDVCSEVAGLELEEKLKSLEALNEGKKDLEQQLRDLNVSLAKQQQRAEAAEAQLREAERRADGSNEDLVKALRTELRSQEAEIAAARKLQGKSMSIAVLQEKLQAAERRAQTAERAVKEESGVHNEVSQLKLQAQAWENTAKTLGLDSPGEVFQKLEELRSQCLTAAAAIGQKDAELRETEVHLRAARGQIAETEAALHSVQGLNAELSATAARLERKVALLNKEKEGLQKILASYSVEQQDARESRDEDTSDGSPQALEKKLLEGQVKELQDQKEVLEETVARVAQAAKLVQEKLADSLANTAKVEEQIHQLQQEAHRLEVENNQLQARLDRGEFNSSSTRVLHYILNPEAEARKEQNTQRIEELESELAVLKVQLDRARPPQPSEDGNEHASATPGLAVLEAEIVVLQQKVADLIKREVRLKDVFQKQVTNFREAVYLLFGYRVDMAAEASSSTSTKSQAASFVLRPQHPDSSRAQLVFKFKGGVMDLVPTEYTTKRLKQEVKTFLEEFHSIPAFTANLTMELFQKQTQHT